MKNPLSTLEEILYELKAIRILLEGGKNIPLPPSEEGEDASSVTFTDDEAVFRKEYEREKFYELRGRYPIPGEALPGPLSPSGKPWGEEEKALEGDSEGQEVG